MITLASGVILYRREGAELRLLLLRNRSSGHWGFPKGRRDDGDAHEVETALREVREETGYDGLALHPAFRAQLAYVVRGSDPYSKRVTYFLALAPAHEPALSDEHDRLRWAAAHEIDDLLLHGQLRDLARAALAAAREADG